MNNNCHLYQKNITLEQAMLGGNFKIQVDNGRMVRVKLKPGSFNGQVIRLKALQKPGTVGSGKDTYIMLKVLDHPMYRVDGLNLHATLVLTPAEAKLGCLKKVNGPAGKQINVTVKPASVNGDEIVVSKGGLSESTKYGDIIFRIRIDLLDHINETELIENLSATERILN